MITLGYKRASIKAEGRVEGEERKTWNPPTEDKGKFIKFEGYDGAISNWQFLRLTVKEA
jgi:hypothetical protein